MSNDVRAIPWRIISGVRLVEDIWRPRSAIRIAMEDPSLVELLWVACGIFLNDIELVVGVDDIVSLFAGIKLARVHVKRPEF